MIVDGKAIADDLYAAMKRRAPSGRAATLGILAAPKNPIIESFVRIKTSAARGLGVQIERSDLGSGATSEQAIVAIQSLAKRTDGVIVQLPLPETVDTNAALSAIPDDKDVDAISTATGEHHVDAPVALAVVDILQRSNIEIEGKQVIVIGEGRLVGKPVAELLKRLGAKVSLLTLERGSTDELKEADVVVCGAGNPGFIKPEMLKHGVALIDAGTSESRTSASRKIVGDCDPRCAEVASVFTPVPGGVGPVAVAMIFKNLFDLMEKK